MKIFLAGLMLIATSVTACAADANDGHAGGSQYGMIEWPHEVYVGAALGIAATSSDTRSGDSTTSNFDIGPFFTNSAKRSLSGGLYLGSNWLISNWLIGAESDLYFFRLGHRNANTLNNNGSPYGIANAQINDKSNGVGSLRARIGYKYNQIAPYFTIGVSFMERNYNGYAQANSTQPEWKSSYSFTRYVPGLVIGAGLEYDLTMNIKIRSEYVKYLNKNDRYVVLPSNGTFAANYMTYSKTNIGMARIGLSYSFATR